VPSAETLRRLLEGAQAEQTTWYQTEFASKLAADLQLSESVCFILQSVDLMRSGQTEAQAVANRGLSNLLEQGRALTTMLQRYTEEFLNCDLHSVATVVLRMTHPDTRDPDLPEEFSEQEIQRFYREALVANRRRPGIEVDRFLDAATRLFDWKIRFLLRCGGTLADVCEQQPGLVASLELMRWLGFVREKRIAVLNVVKKPSLRPEYQEKPQTHEESEGLAVIASVVEDLYKFMEIENDHTLNHLRYLRSLLAHADRLVDLGINRASPLAEFKVRTVRSAIDELVRPVSFLATTARARKQARDRDPSAEGPDIRSASADVAQFLSNLESALGSYIEWLIDHVPQHQRGNVGNLGR
jgi:hypothetical protein